MKDNLEIFIDFIIDFAKDEFDYCISSHVLMKDFFRYGGCLELAKIIHYFIPNVKICISKDLGHFVVLYNQAFYDAYGKKEISVKESYDIVSYDYIEHYEERYGYDILFGGQKPHLALIKEINFCKNTYLDDLLNQLNHATKNR